MTCAEKKDHSKMKNKEKTFLPREIERFFPTSVLLYLSYPLLLKKKLFLKNNLIYIFFFFGWGHQNSF